MFTEEDFSVVAQSGHKDNKETPMSADKKESLLVDAEVVKT